MERDALSRVYENYRRPLLLYALALCGEPQEAEDLVQSAFLKALLSYRSTGSLRHWLVKVLRNEFLTGRKRRARFTDDPEALDALRAPEGDLLEGYIRDEEKRRLFAAIAALPDLQKAVLLDGVYFGLTDAEIADAHGITRENVRQLRSRGKKRLRELLREEEAQ